MKSMKKTDESDDDDDDENDDDDDDNEGDDFIGKGFFVYKHFCRYHRQFEIFFSFASAISKKKSILRLFRARETKPPRL